MLGPKSLPVSPPWEEMTDPEVLTPILLHLLVHRQPHPARGRWEQRSGVVGDWWGIPGVPTPTVGSASQQPPYTLGEPPPAPPPFTQAHRGAWGSGMGVIRAGRGSPSSQYPEPGPAPWPSHLSWPTPRCRPWRLGYCFGISHAVAFPLYLGLTVHKKINGLCK